MNLETLRRFARWAEKISAVLAELSRDLSTELHKAESVQDPLGLFIYQARSSYRRTSDIDKNKSGKKSDLALQTSFHHACDLGYVGSRAQWDQLMRSGLAVSSHAFPISSERAPLAD